MATDQDPMIQRRRLRIELSRAREAAGLSYREVVPEMDWSLSKLIRIEAGAVGISVNDVRALLVLYKITDPERIAEFIAMAKAAREQAWWAKYKVFIPPEFAAFLSYESSASKIRNFEPLLLPGLLQTKEYAKAAVEEFFPAGSRSDLVTTKKIESLVELRMERQERLAGRQESARTFFAMDEAVLHRWVGGPDIMRDQLLHLKGYLESAETDIWIVPFKSGLYQRMRGPFVLFELQTTGEDENILYLENTSGETNVKDDRDLAATYLEAFLSIEQIALRNGAAVTLVDKALGSLTDL